MPTVLYISPFFPPLSRIGARGPLNMVRGLSHWGWNSVVLCDLWPGAPTDIDLLEAIPADTIVCRDFSARARPAESQLLARGRDNFEPRPAAAENQTPRWISDREWLPLGEMAFNIPHAVKAARRLVAEHGCAVIIAHSTPVASLVVGEMLSRQTGVPLVVVLGDPWMPCELNGPRRPIHTRLIEAWRERRVIAQAARVVLFTRGARDDYRTYYPAVDKERFTCIHRGVDASLTSRGGKTAFDCFTMLFLGFFTGHVPPDPFLRLLAALKARGVKAGQLALAVTDGLDDRAMEMAHSLAVDDLLLPIDAMRYGSVGAAMAAADILLMSLPTPQRLQAKLYDYLVSERPILAVSDHHPELDEMLAATNAGRRFANGDTGAMADFVLGCMKAGRHPISPRPAAALEKLHVHETGRQLSQILDQVMP